MLKWGKRLMKKMLIIIVVLASILITMIIYKNMSVGSKNNVNIREIQNIEDSISKIYLWKEVTKNALPEFQNINDADDLWIWEVVKKNIEKYELTFEDIEQTSKELFGEEFSKEFPKEGNGSFEYDAENDFYLATEVNLDKMEDNFLILDIKKKQEEYEVDIIEYLEDYSNEEKIVIRNINEEEIGQVSINDSETKIQDIVKENETRFNKKKLYFKTENNKLIIQKIEKSQE